MSTGGEHGGAGDDGRPEVSDLLARATTELREAPERAPTWQDISDGVVGALRTITRRSTWVVAPLERGSADGRPGAPDTVSVSDQAIATLVRRTLRALPGCAPSGLDVEVDDAGRCTGLLVEVVAAYGEDLQRLAGLVRERTAAVLAEALGPVGAPPPESVAVQVVDVTEGDPRA